MKSSYTVLTIIVAIIGFSVPTFSQDINGDSYEILDGTTAPTLAQNAITSPGANTPAIIPEATTEGEEGIQYNIVSSKPPCTNSTCITSQSIANADHAFVYTSPIKSYISSLEPPDDGSTCNDPTPTGMTIYRQVVEGGTGKTVRIQDGFCLNQGCVYFGGIGNEKCE